MSTQSTIVPAVTRLVGAGIAGAADVGAALGAALEAAEVGAVAGGALAGAVVALLELHAPTTRAAPTNRDRMRVADTFNR